MRLIFFRYKWVLFSVVFFIIAIPIAGFLLSKNNPKPPTQSVIPTPTQFISLCKQFEKAIYPVSCQKAVEKALANKKGDILNITIGPLELNPDALKRILGNSKNEMWRIDIKLAEPFTAPNGTEVKSLRIEIPTDGSEAIFRIPIKS